MCNNLELNGGFLRTLFTKEFLSKVRFQALRKRVWYSTLDNLERGILTVAARVIDEVKSTLLNVQLVKIIAKLKEASLGRLARQIRDFGGRRAKEISLIGVRFGSSYARGWVDDGFARYFAFISLNLPIGWSI